MEVVSTTGHGSSLSNLKLGETARKLTEKRTSNQVLIRLSRNVLYAGYPKSHPHSDADPAVSHPIHVSGLPSTSMPLPNPSKPKPLNPEDPVILPLYTTP